MSNLTQDIQTYDMMLRWAEGEPLGELAAELNIAEPTLRHRIEKLDTVDYAAVKKQARQARADLTTAKYDRAANRTLNEIIKRTEDDAERNGMEIKELLSINKQTADRAALRKGEATERQEVQGQVTQIVTFSEAVNDDPE
jgi:replicative superfamily II helicase